MIIVAQSGNFYQTDTAIRMHLETEGDPTQYKLCVAYGAVWDGLALQEITYELLDTTDENLRLFIIGEITNAFLGRDPFYNVSDGIAEYNE